MAADNLKADLQRVTTQRILFGHQSVGANVMDGIKQLAQKEGVAVDMVEVRTSGEVKSATFGHTYIAENGNPTKKFESFESAMGADSSGPDVAFLKLCYVDFSSSTDAASLFAKYRATIDRLKAKHPGTTFVHVTAPLTSKQTGAKAFVKRLLGRGDSVVNWRREEYNALLRQTYQGKEPIFDVARVESTDPDGTAVTEEWNGKTVPAMAQEYTNDGGHLNEVGQVRAARELVSVLAGIRSRSAPADPARK